jgi:16S rRNA (guanine527-N7)-methyltransferase
LSDDARRADLQRLGISVSRETFDALIRFEQLFLRWNARINLASGSTLEQFWNRHILDSAQLLPLAPDAKNWLDLGSGGGLPGIVIGILLKERDGASAVLVESNGKKASFLRTAARELAVPVTVLCSRIEDVRLSEPPNVVTARALASLTTLFGLAEPWLSGEATGLFHKGRDYRREIEESHADWHYDLIEHRSVAAPDSVILEVGNLRRR